MYLSDIEIRSTYDEIAAEYYDSAAHPTCANFSELSARFLRPKIINNLRNSTRVLEMGAGRSLVAPIMAAELLPLKKLILLDNSPAMLKYSQRWRAHGADFIIGEASNTALPAGNIQLIVSSLGDSYNGPQFWREVNRLLDDKIGRAHV